MKRDGEFQQNKRKVLEKQSCCEICGRTIGLEVHHKIPLIQGGTNAIENLQVLCGVCHEDKHKYDRSTLTKLGLEKAKHKKVKPLISKNDFYFRLNDLLDETNIISIEDILDIIDSLPIEKWKDIGEKELANYN